MIKSNVEKKLRYVTLNRCDVTKQNDWEKMWDHTEETFGGKVQVLVNNAGINPSVGWKPCIDIMLYGVMIGSFLARERMGRVKVCFYTFFKCAHCNAYISTRLKFF